MFKGLFTNISLPYAQFAAHSLKGHEMFPHLWKVISRLTRIGCCILGVTCDGSSPNQRLFQLYKVEVISSTIIHKAENVYNKDHKDLFCRPSPSNKNYLKLFSQPCLEALGMLIICLHIMLCMLHFSVMETILNGNML